MKITASYARDSSLGRRLWSRPSAAVPFCLQPLDPSGHICRGPTLPSRALSLNLDNHPALSAALTEGDLTVTGRLLQASNATSWPS